MDRKFSISILPVLILVSFSSAELQLGIDGEVDQIGINFEQTMEILGVGNVTNWWNTTIGMLRTPNSTQFDNNGGTLSIDEAWLMSIAETTDPAGSNGQVQFNDGGSFGAESGFLWDAVNNRLGINKPSPSFSLHVGGTTGLDGTLAVNGISTFLDDVIMSNNNILNVSNVTLVDSIKDSDTESRAYWDSEGAFVVEG